MFVCILFFEAKKETTDLEIFISCSLETRHGTKHRDDGKEKMIHCVFARKCANDMHINKHPPPTWGNYNIFIQIYGTVL